MSTTMSSTTRVALLTVLAGVVLFVSMTAATAFTDWRRHRAKCGRIDAIEKAGSKIAEAQGRVVLDWSGYSPRTDGC